MEGPSAYVRPLSRREIEVHLQGAIGELQHMVGRESVVVATIVPCRWSALAS